MPTKGKGHGNGLTRRDFIHGVAAATGSLLLPGCETSSPLAGSGSSTLPDPKDSGIDHVVVVMMENRSFDHLLGWVPGADGAQAGLKFKDGAGNEQETFDLAPNFQNCHLADPDHTYDGGRHQINDGRMDGFLATQPIGDSFPIGYYTGESLPFYKGCAEHWTVCDRYFSGILGATTPNRIYMHAGQTDRISNTLDVSTLPTVWDRMLGAGHSAGYYYGDIAYTAYWGDKYRSISKCYESFARDVASGSLPNLSFVDFVSGTLGEGGGLARDDHPVTDIRNGQAFLNEVYSTLSQGPQWERTLLIINYDEWGGFYDHVTPPFAPISDTEAVVGNDGRLGCRVPCVLIGPRARRGHVEHLQFDPNSILNFLAWNFGFEPLGVRVHSNNLAHALDFSRPADMHAPAFDVPPGPHGGLCLPIGALSLALIQAGISMPQIIPELPVVPLPLQLQLPLIPGVDVSLNSFIQHQMELEAVRNLGRSFGFQLAC